MTLLFIIGIIYIVYRLIKEACEPKLPAPYHNNWKLEAEDSFKVSQGIMSKNEFLRNIRNGKYR